MLYKLQVACYAILLICALVSATLVPSSATQVKDATITIDNFTFSPPALTVKIGTTVTWKNNDDIPHTATSDKHLFKSKALDTGDSFSYTFNEPGDYAYFCSLHPHMTGQIAVEKN